ncbi:amino acid adenylation domain-containing protein [Kitasatospora sp. NPDC048722]|uniref:non-ribosomal peptide synthetase n=1 Tax=Kitasatospora sp. NPDC048722 TaxID=3155639 RepID=UPI0033FA3EC4
MNGLLSRTDCIGPITVSADVMRTLHSLSTAAGVDDFVALSICVGVLAERLPRPGTDLRVRVTRQERDAVLPRPDAPDPAMSFRDALRQAARSEAAATAETGDDRVAVTILVSRDGRNLYAESMTDSSDVPSTEAWAQAFLQLLIGMTDDPDAPMLSHPLVGPEESERIRHGLNPHRDPEIRYRTMAAPFEEQAECTPDLVALQDEDGTTVTYRELNERANRLAHHLRGLGARPGTRIGICLQRGIPQVVAIYAAVKTGATYVPLDADLPDQRIALILADSEPGLVLTDPVCRDHLPEGPWEIHDVGTGQAGSGRPTTNLVLDDGPGLVHILYTSGTTGRPKGVVSRTAGTLANLSWMQRQYPFRAAETALFKASPGFDISIWELFWPLYHGARLVICRPGGERDPRHLARLARDHGVSQIFLVPTMMTAFLEEMSQAGSEALRWVVCGGEPMSPRIPEAFAAVLPGSSLVNAFGPTEAGPVTDNVVDPGSTGGSVPVGRPADNFRLTVLDANLDLVPIGTPGEAYISGQVGLSDGYWRQPAQTAERFVADPYGPPGSRMYRTGDLCRYRADGTLEHLGRIDRQVKIRGLRIEPGEVESVLAAHPAVGDCAVIAHGQPLRLLAFVVPAGQGSVTDLDPAAVLEHAAGLLPAQMRPDRVVPVDYLPATVNGKIDQGELIRIWQELAERERPVEPPADELEAALVQIYQRVLGRSPISVLDTFLQVGGHSMLTFRLLDECKATLRAEPDMTQLLHGTLRDVAATIRTTTIPSPRD